MYSTPDVIKNGRGIFNYNLLSINLRHRYSLILNNIYAPKNCLKRNEVAPTTAAKSGFSLPDPSLSLFS